MKTVELYDHVMTPTGRFGDVVGLGEFVGEVRIKFVDGQHEDIQVNRLSVIDPEFVSSRSQLLDALKSIVLDLNLSESNHPHAIKALQAIKRAES
jgi:hypothetical protein